MQPTAATLMTAGPGAVADPGMGADPGTGVLAQSQALGRRRALTAMNDGRLFMLYLATRLSRHAKHADTASTVQDEFLLLERVPLHLH